MWPFTPSARSEERRLLMETLKAITEASAAQAKAAASQAAAVEAHLALFKAPTPPTGWVNRDEEEFYAELERKGFPRHGTQEEQLKWIETNADADLETIYEMRPATE